MEGECLSKLGVEYGFAIECSRRYIAMSDLRAANSPFRASRSARLQKRAKEIIVSVSTVFLIFVAVLGFVISEDITQNIAELQQIALQNPLQKLSDLRRLVSEGALDDPKSAYYAQYQKALSDVTLMFANSKSILDRSAAADSQLESSNGIIGALMKALYFEIAGTGNSTGLSPVDQSNPNCMPYSQAGVKALMGAENQGLLKAALDRFDDSCLAQTLSINANYRSDAVAGTIRMLQGELFTIGVLFLPLIGGLLGSVVFIVHALMNDRLSAPMTWSYIFVRVIVGGGRLA